MNDNFEYLFEGNKRIDALSKQADNILSKSELTLNEAQKTNDMNKDVQKQLDNLILENGQSDAEVIQARGGLPLLKDRLDKSESLLENTTILANRNKNAAYPLRIPTYENSGQSVHPSVIYVAEKWNGYSYWMAHTPYPNGNDDFENPSIIASNDGVNWETPVGLVNPIDEPTPEEITLGGHMSDTHLIIVNGVMECFYRFRIPGQGEQIFKKTSVDGKKWSERHTILDSNALGNYYLSPAIIYEQGKYRMWFVGSGNKVFYTESEDSSEGTWSKFVEIPVSYKNEPLTPWHLDVYKESDKYYILLNAFLGANTSLTKRVLAIGSSLDGLSFSNIEIMLRPPVSSSSWDGDFIYRSSLIKVSNVYKLYYSARSVHGIWGIGLIEGLDMFSLGTSHSQDSKGFAQHNNISAKALTLTDEILFFERGVGGARLKMQGNGVRVETEKGNLGVFDTRILNTQNVEAEILINTPRLTTNILDTAEIRKKGSGSLVLPSFSEIRGNSTTPPHLKLLNTGVAGAGLKTERANTIRVVSDSGNLSGNVEASGIYLDSTGSTVANVEGAIRYNSTLKKHQGYDGTEWNDLY